MKRKVIQLAGKTLVVSLPAKWARKCGVKKGDEMEVEESETGLSINCASSATCEKYVLDISGFNDSLIWYYLTSAYRRGCDEIEITFDNNLTENARTRKKLPVKNVISNIVDGLVGIEVVRHGKQYCLIKEISSVKEEEFESVFRKIFLLLLSLGEELSAAINENDPERLENIKYTEKNINKLVFFCERILNKSRAFSSRKHQVYFFVLEELEEIADCFAKFSGDIPEIKGIKEKKIFEEINEITRLFYEAFYETEKKISEFHKKRLKVNSMIRDIKDIKLREKLGVFIKNNDLMMSAMHAKLMTLL